MVSSSEQAAFEPWAARLRAVLDDRTALLAELEAATARQEEVIESRDTASLAELLAGRQRIVDRFLAGQPELLELTGAMEERMRAMSREDAEDLRRRVRAISDGLARVTARDDAAQALLRTAREETRAELRRTATGAGARAAYATRPEHSNRFADRRI